MRHTHAFPSFIPTRGDLVRISGPALSATSTILTYATQREGGLRKQKLLVRCMTGPGDHQGNIQLIWKPSTGWFCWIGGKHFPNLKVERG